MKKSILILMLAVATLTTGCASRYAGPAVAGGIVGLAVGSAMAQPRRVVVREEVVVVSTACQGYATHNEQAACERGIRQRYMEEQRRRENEAYRNGLGR
jgi:hypothetical protein